MSTRGQRGNTTQNRPCEILVFHSEIRAIESLERELTWLYLHVKGLSSYFRNSGKDDGESNSW